MKSILTTQWFYSLPSWISQCLPRHITCVQEVMQDMIASSQSKTKLHIAMYCENLFVFVMLESAHCKPVTLKSFLAGGWFFIYAVTVNFSPLSAQTR